MTDLIESMIVLARVLPLVLIVGIGFYIYSEYKKDTLGG